jgi:hypothetical protein
MFISNLPFRSWLRSVAILLFAAGLLMPGAQAAPPSPNLTVATTAFLKKFVTPEGNVNYGAIKRNPLELKALLRRYEATDAMTLSEADRKAFYLNAYNMLVIGEVVAHYPLVSVQKVPGFFDQNLVSVAGEKMTLNDLEKNKISSPYHDPRTHFVLVGAAKGSPRLSRDAYVGNQLEAQLTIQTRRVLQEPTFVRLDDQARTVLLPQLFKWYEADFKASGKTNLAYVTQFRAKPLPAGYTPVLYPYDWALNDQK